MMRTLAHLIATLGYVSYYVYAPGTMASIITACLLVLFPLSLSTYTVLLIVTLFTAYYSIQYALPLFREQDPSYIVIDECAGCLVTFFAIPCTLPFIISGLVLFRFFDITKIGIAPLQKLSKARGVLADDIAAGIIANCIMRIIMWIWL